MALALAVRRGVGSGTVAKDLRPLAADASRSIQKTLRSGTDLRVARWNDAREDSGHR